MERILLIGLGGIGGSTVDAVCKWIRDKEKKNPSGNQFEAIVLDCDVGDLLQCENAKTLSIPDVSELAQRTALFPKSAQKSIFGDVPPQEQLQEMGSMNCRSRRLSAACFYFGMMKKELVEQLTATLQRMSLPPRKRDTYSCYFVSSISGSFGSAVMIPLAYYVTHYFRAKGLTLKRYALLLQPFVKKEQQMLIDPSVRLHHHTNAYATMRELYSLNLLAKGHNTAAITDYTLRHISFRLGDKNLPNVSVLLDSDDMEQKISPPFNKLAFLDNDLDTFRLEKYTLELRERLNAIISAHLTEGAPALPPANKAAMEPYNEALPQAYCYKAYRLTYPRFKEDFLRSPHIIPQFFTLPFINPQQEKHYRYQLACALLYGILSGKTALCVKNWGIFLREFVPDKPDIFITAITAQYLSNLFYSPDVVKEYAKALEELVEETIGTLPEPVTLEDLDAYTEAIHNTPLVQQLLYRLSSITQTEKPHNLATFGYFETVTNFSYFPRYPTNRLFDVGYRILLQLAASKLPEHFYKKETVIVAKLIERMNAAILADTTLTDEEKENVIAFVKKSIPS